MRNRICGLLVLVLLTVLCSSTLAEQKVFLPDSRYRLTIPDGLEYDGPGDDPDDARFAYVSAAMGLEIDFFCYESRGVTLQAMAEVLAGERQSVSIYRINGIDMIVYELSDPDDPPERGMKCIGYALLDGTMVQEICFWYATQEAADLTATIISSITDKD